MSNSYYDTVDKMEKAGVDAEYILGWQCGYWLNPEREEQRLTEAYEAGFAAGKDKSDEGYQEWVKS
ncbi:MAG: Alvin_2107 family globule sulfur oxidation protein [bacterium]